MPLHFTVHVKKWQRILVEKHFPIKAFLLQRLNTTTAALTERYIKRRGQEYLERETTHVKENKR